ncbi:MAG: O-antigen ligase family protein [Fluviibacter phosphoraccumulans]
MQALRVNAFWGWLVPALIALGLFFSIASHLRLLTGGVIGPGEMVLAVVAGLGLLFGKPWQQIKNPIVWFWGLLVLTMGLGALTGNLQGHWVMRNTQAYVFTGFVVLGLLSLLRLLPDAALRRTLALLALVAAAGMWIGFVVYLMGDQTLIQRIGLNDMGDTRYAGWSSNPNQLALFFIPLPVWLAALWRDVLKPRLSQTVGFGLLLLALMLMGLLVRSDGLFVVWVFEFAVLLVLRLRWDLKVSRMSLLGYAMAMVLCVGLIKTFAHGEVRKSFQCATQTIGQGLNPWKAQCYTGAFADKEAFRIGYSDPVEKTGIRGDLWRNGLKAWQEAPFFGHGPGAYSWFSNSEYQKAAEAEGKFREESHNIPIDLMTQGGPLLALAWCALLLYLLLGAWRIRDSYTFSVVLMVGVFTLFHYHIRQPYLWFALIMSYEAIRRRLFVGGRSQDD